MGSIVNGIALHGGMVKPYGSTFLIFSDYMRPAVRLSALSSLPVVWVWTHDSVGLGEDGPTHQPVEHFAALRAIPNLWFMRPADANETVQAWKVALEREDGPGRARADAAEGADARPASARRRRGTRRAARTSSGSPRRRTALPDLILLATGSEVHLALEAARALAEQGTHARVVSMPCWELFEAQPREYRDEVLPPDVKARVSVEAGVAFGWRQWVGDEGDSISIERFGASAPGATVLEELGVHASTTSSPAALALRERVSWMNVAVAFDHRGVQLRERLLEVLREDGHEIVDLGTDTDAQRVDYPDKALELGAALKGGRAERGVLVCGSGVGASVAACKIAGIRAAICHDVYSAHQGVEHDDMNVLCLGSEVVGPSLAADLVRAFLGARFDGGRALRRETGESGSDGKRDAQWLSRDCTSSARAASPSGSTTCRATMLESGELDADDGGGRRRRRDVEPDDLPEGDLPRRRVRRAAAASCSRARPTRRRSSSSSPSRDVEAALDAARRRCTRRIPRTATSRCEVDPTLAYDAEATFDEAMRLHAWIDRPNLYVKIPATQPGLRRDRGLHRAGRRAST